MHTHQRTHHIRTHIDAPNLPPIELNKDSNAYENFSLQNHMINNYTSGPLLFTYITGGLIVIIAVIYFSKRIRKNLK